MAKFTATTVNALQTEIMRRANKAMKNSVAPYVEDKLKQHIKKDVYSTYSPVEYDRREADGGLLNESKDSGISSTYRTADRTLTVFERAPVDPPKLEHKEYNAPDGLAKLIEEGAHNPWNNRHYKWENPRPFVSKTQADINTHNSAIVKMLKDQIEHDKE